MPVLAWIRPRKALQFRLLHIGWLLDGMVVMLTGWMWAHAPIFFWCWHLSETSLHAVIEQTVRALGYELVEFERAGRGMLRVMIDQPAHVQMPVKIEDCEKVSRQLSHVLMVEEVDYARLQVESPGVDRPLKRLDDYVRFAGQDAVVKLRLPVAGRKSFTGKLLPPQGQGADAKLALEFASQGKGQDKGQGNKKDKQQDRKQGGKRGQEQQEVQVLEFVLSEVDRAHLNPVLDFRKGMR
jgi:ribosome maturation factor RimP